MTSIGYALSSEEHGPNELVRFAVRAEEVGFEFAMISDHYHPWIDAQGQAPFVWSVLGGIAVATHRIAVGTGVTCPTVRYHPAEVAQMAATLGVMMPGRFFLGLGSGEALNEHIYGDHWPPANVRLDMLEEAVEVIYLLWEGEETSYWGEYFTVENACLYTLPDQPVPLYIAASGMDSAELAGELAEGLISTSADKELVQRFEESGGEGKPKIGQIKVCWAESEEEAFETVKTYWPVSVIPGSLHSDLPTPAHFEQAVQIAKLDELRNRIVLGRDVDKHLEKIQKMVDAGFDHVYIHQVGHDQEGFFRFYEKEILPKFR